MAHDESQHKGDGHSQTDESPDETGSFTRAPRPASRRPGWASRTSTASRESGRSSLNLIPSTAKIEDAIKKTVAKTDLGGNRNSGPR
jgi:hypothetical protein